MSTIEPRRMKCDVLVIGGGGAALYAAIRARDAAPEFKVLLASKGIAAKSGCTRMVQGGYNVVLNADDSIDRHFDDTLRGGSLINDQELAWTLVNEAPARIHELENAFGCYFDRNPDGTIHFRALAGQSFNRTIHRGDLTGIEIMSRLEEQLRVRDIQVLDEVRGIELLLDRDGRTVTGALLLDYHSGDFIAVEAKSTVIATGGAAPLYKITAASQEKTGDGLAMAWRAGAEFVDMEMMQFHPTGLIAGKMAITGCVLEEGLRGAGGHLLNKDKERFMARYDAAKMERSTRDRVSRSSFLEIRAGRGTADGGIWLDVRHLGRDFLMKSSPGMVARCLSVGVDMINDLVPVTPTAHFQMGGVRIDPRCRASLEGLFVAGEDAGGVHGANRLGGNGVAESMVFGRIAGDSAAEWARGVGDAQPDRDRLRSMLAPFERARDGRGSSFALRQEIGAVAWDHLGLIRSAQSLEAAAKSLDRIQAAYDASSVPAVRGRNPAFHEGLNVRNLIDIARLIHAGALLRQESRGSHFREDFPETETAGLCNFFLRRDAGGKISSERRPVKFSRRRPEHLAGDTVIAPTNAKSVAAQ